MPFTVLYAIHDAMVKPMPTGLTTASPAESLGFSGIAGNIVARRNALSC